jgi:hypothetical protein
LCSADSRDRQVPVLGDHLQGVLDLGPHHVGSANLGGQRGFGEEQVEGFRLLGLDDRALPFQPELGAVDHLNDLATLFFGAQDNYMLYLGRENLRSVVELAGKALAELDAEEPADADDRFTASSVVGALAVSGVSLLPPVAHR